MTLECSLLHRHAFLICNGLQLLISRDVILKHIILQRVQVHTVMGVHVIIYGKCPNAAC